MRKKKNNKLEIAGIVSRIVHALVILYDKLWPYLHDKVWP